MPFDDLEPDDYLGTLDAVADLAAREVDGSWLLFRYEDMVDGRYDRLNRYLGFDVAVDAEVARGLERVVRRKGYGDWRHWFTPADVARYGSGVMDRYLTTFGYDRDDWALAARPRIEPAHGSAYMSALFADWAAPARPTPARTGAGIGAGAAGRRVPGRPTRPVRCRPRAAGPAVAGPAG